MNGNAFTVLHMDLTAGRRRVFGFGDSRRILGGSGLSAALFEEFGGIDLAQDDPRQPLIFAIGPLTGYFPLMSKVCCGFRSPYTKEYAESYAGGRLALSMRFAGYEAIVITGRAPSLSCLCVDSRSAGMEDVHYLRGRDVFTTARLLRRTGKSTPGHRSMIRIGPAGEHGSAYACINVDTFRHFGRLGAGGVMGAKNLKAAIITGDGSLPLPKGKEYAKLYRDVYAKVTKTDMMHKYHDLGTAVNLSALNELKSLPWRNLQATTDEAIDGISGERFAEQLLLRQAACAGCPVGCIHVGLLRQQFARDHEYLYKQVSYDYEPIFAQGSMLGMNNASDVLALMDETEKQGLDVMSSGVALAWATEALEKGLISVDETIVPLSFNDPEGYLQAIRLLGCPPNEFYRLLGQGVLHAARRYGGEEFACVLGQEMAGYATGEVFFISEAFGFRHSHLDSGGYAYDQKHQAKDAEHAVRFLVLDERHRIAVNCMVACMFSRAVYTEDMIAEALRSIGMHETAEALPDAVRAVQCSRWSHKRRTGYDPFKVKIPKRFREVVTWKGPIDGDYLDELREAYTREILIMMDEGDCTRYDG